MNKPRFSLFSRILAWFFLSLLILGVVLFGLFNLQFRLDPASRLGGTAGNRVETVSQLILRELNRTGNDGWDDVLEGYSDAYDVDFALVTPKGQQLAGVEISLPESVLEQIALPPSKRIPRGQRPPRDHEMGNGTPPHHQDPPPRSPHHDGSDRESRPVLEAHPPLPMPGSEMLFRLRTSDPTRYWYGVKTFVRTNTRRQSIPVALLAVSDSITGNGLFFDPVPWLGILIAIVLVSIAVWLPLVRSITRPIRDVTRAAGEIAHGRFDVRLKSQRSDEIGQLSRSINEMASRLEVLVKGQKRFLGDVAHELASPLVRMQMAMGILEQTVEEKHRLRVADAAEEAQHMSNLVNELLSFSRAEINPSKVQLTNVLLKPVASRVSDREQVGNTEIRVDIDEKLAVVADAQLLARALSNLLRNAVRYAGDAGPIHVSAKRSGSQVQIEVRDSGPGVDDDTVDRLFEPFFRPDSSRERQTGGVGLGLAIVKTCVETCRGTVTARNLEPHGFAVTVELRAANGGSS